MSGRVAVSAVSSWRWTFDEDLAFWDRAGIEDVVLSLRKLDEAGRAAATRRVVAAGLAVAAVGEVGWWDLDDPATWPAQRDRLDAAADAAAATGAATVVLTSGPAGSHRWADALARLCDAVAPVRDRAAAAGVQLALENTSPLRLDLSFVTTLRDCVDAAGEADVGVCVEVNSCFAERDVDDTLRRGVALGRVRHVQLSDFVVGSTSTPDRAVPGDGDIPLARILDVLATAGYRGPFELELVGPRIEAEGYEPAIRRALARLAPLLDATVTP